MTIQVPDRVTWNNHQDHGHVQRVLRGFYIVIDDNTGDRVPLRPREITKEGP